MWRFRWKFSHYFLKIKLAMTNWFIKQVCYKFTKYIIKFAFFNFEMLWFRPPPPQNIANQTVRLVLFFNSFTVLKYKNIAVWQSLNKLQQFLNSFLKVYSKWQCPFTEIFKYRNTYLGNLKNLLSTSNTVLLHFRADHGGWLWHILSQNLHPLDLTAILENLEYSVCHKVQLTDQFKNQKLHQPLGRIYSTI